MADRNIFSLAEEWSANMDHFLLTPDGHDLVKDLEAWEKQIVLALARSLIPVPIGADPLLVKAAEAIKADSAQDCLKQLEAHYGSSDSAEQDVKADFYCLQAMSEKLSRAVRRFLLVPDAGRSPDPISLREGSWAAVWQERHTSPICIEEPDSPSDRPTKRVDPPDHLLELDEPCGEIAGCPNDSATVRAPPDYDRHTARMVAGQAGLYNLAMRVGQTAIDAEPLAVSHVSNRPAMLPPPSVPEAEKAPVREPIASARFVTQEEESDPDRPTPFLGDQIPGVIPVPTEAEPIRPGPDPGFSEVETVIGETEVDPADLQAWEDAEIDQALDDFSVTPSKDGRS